MQEQSTTAKHTPGPDKRNNYWLDCGCMVNRLLQQRCSLHHAAPDLLAALEAASALLHDARHTYGLTVSEAGNLETLVDAAIAAVKGQP